MYDFASLDLTDPHDESWKYDPVPPRLLPLPDSYFLPPVSMPTLSGGEAWRLANEFLKVQEDFGEGLVDAQIILRSVIDSYCDEAKLKWLGPYPTPEELFSKANIWKMEQYDSPGPEFPFRNPFQLMTPYHGIERLTPYQRPAHRTELQPWHKQAVGVRATSSLAALTGLQSAFAQVASWAPPPPPVPLVPRAPQPQTSSTQALMFMLPPPTPPDNPLQGMPDFLGDNWSPGDQGGFDDSAATS